MSFTNKTLKLENLSKSGKKGLGVICAVLLFQTSSFSQTILYDESMDSGAGAVNGETVSVHESSGRFSELGLTYTGTADMRNTLPSAGYATATGNFNVMFNSTGESFSMDGLDFSSCLTDIVLSFGIRKGTNLSDGTSIIIQYNTYDDLSTFNTLTFPALPTGTGTAGWYYRSTNTLIPSNVKSLRFASLSAVEMRIDDIHIECNTVTCPLPTLTGNPIDITSCQNQPVTFGSAATSTTKLTYQWQVDMGAGFVNLTNGLVYTDVDKDSLKILNTSGTMTGYKYRCRITNTCGTSITTNGILTIDAVLTPSITASGPTTFCLGQSVVLTSSSPINNIWSTGETTQSITVNGDDDYKVKVFNNNCSETSPVTKVTVNDPSFSLDNILNPTTCVSLDGRVRLNGSATGLVSWTGALSGNSGVSVSLPFTMSALMKGTYNITFTVSPGCFSTAVITLVGDIPIPTITSNKALTICDGDSVRLISSALVDNNWSTGETTRSIWVKTAGTYNVTVTSGTCIKTSRDTILIVNPVSILSILSTTAPSSCGLLDGVIQVGGVGTGTLSWTGAATGSMLATTLPANISGLGAGSYTISFLNGTCPSIPIVQSLTDPGAPATPTISASGPLSFCAGGSVTLTSSSAVDNTWSTGETTQSIVVSTTSDVFVSVTNLSGCTSVSSVTNVISNAYPAVPIISVEDTVVFCLGDSAVLTSSALNNNTWSTGETTQSIVVKTSGTYNVTVDNAGCTTISMDTIVQVNVNTNLLIGSTIDPSSCGSSNGVIAFAGINGPSMTGNLSWTGPTTFGPNAATLPYTASGLPSGSYDFTFTSSTGCIGLSTVVLTGPSTLPTISASGPLTFCEGGNVILGSSFAVGNVWSNATVAQNITVIETGTYTVTVTDGTCTLTSLPTTVTVTPRPILTQGTSTSPSTCGNTDGSIQILGTGTGNLIWVGTASGNANGITLPFTVPSLKAGSYDFRFDNGCASNVYTFNLLEASVPSTPVITASGSTALCTGQNVILTSSAATNNVWNTGATTQSITATLSGNYTVSITEGTCTETSDPLIVTVVSSPPTPFISSSDADNTVCAGNTITLSSTGLAASVWSDGSTGTTLDVTSSGNYTVSVTQNGCTSTSASIAITVNPIPATPIITASGPISFCQGSSVTLSSSSATGNVWSNGANTQTINVNTAGTFSVTVVQNGCSAVSANTTTIVNAIPTALLAPYNPICDSMPAFVLNQGLPAGGTYTVNGVANTSFDPGTAIVGTNTIVYSVTQNGCTGTTSQTILVQDCTVSIDENHINYFVVYPNPTSGIISLSGDKLKEITSIEVRDELGRLVQSYDQNSMNNINVNQLANGIYTLIIKAGSFEESQRIQLLK